MITNELGFMMVFGFTQATLDLDWWIV